MNQLVNAVERFGINELMVVPPIIVNLVTMSGSKAFLKHVRFVWCGGAPLDGAIMKRMYRLLAEDACIAQVYGMTEAGWISTLKWPERDDSGSVGRLLPNVEAKYNPPVLAAYLTLTLLEAGQRSRCLRLRARCKRGDLRTRTAPYERVFR